MFVDFDRQLLVLRLRMNVILINMCKEYPIKVSIFNIQILSPFTTMLIYKSVKLTLWLPFNTVFTNGFQNYKILIWIPMKTYIMSSMIEE